MPLQGCLDDPGVSLAQLVHGQAEDPADLQGVTAGGAQTELAQTAELAELAADAGSADVPGAGSTLVARLSAASEVREGEQAQVLRRERERLARELAAMPGITVFPSEANMLLVRVPDSARAFDGLKQSKVLVKHIAGLHPLLVNCLRLTVGTPDENTLMIRALEESL